MVDKKLGRGLEANIDDLSGLVNPGAPVIPPAPAEPVQSESSPKRLGRGFSDLLEEINAQVAPTQPEPKPEPGPRPAERPVFVQPDPLLSTPEAQRAMVMIDTGKVIPNRFQPRKTFDNKALEELANSIKTSGVIQPIVVRPQADGRYEIVTGERRWRASVLLGRQTIPAIMQNIDDRQMLEWALVENIQRKDLNPIERARAYRDLLTGFNLTQEEIAKRVGLERSTVANFLRLLELPGQVQDDIASGALSPTHALPLLSIDSPELQVKLALRARKQAMTVRRLNYIINWIKNRRGRQAAAASPEANRSQLVLKEIEERLRAQLGCKVTINSPDQKRGKLTLEFFSPEGFQRIIDQLDK
ncbi:MAG: ParB/RepB/Spo0J family partition protein [Candidatus Brocadiia bacterium]